MRKLCIALVLVLLFTTFAYAAVMARTSMDLSFTGTTANCHISVKEAGASIDVTMKLYKGSALVKSWHKAGTGKVELDKTWTCISGQTYTLQADVTVGGNPINVTPITETCP